MRKMVVRKTLCFMLATVMLLTMIFSPVTADEGTNNISVTDANEVNNEISAKVLEGINDISATVADECHYICSPLP